MGGDTPLDIEALFEEAFGDGVPSPTDAVAFIHKTAVELLLPEAARYVTGFLMIRRGAPFSAELRYLVLEGLDAEIEEGAIHWGDPDARLAELRSFRAIVEAYPKEGKQVDLPHQPGLMETIAAGMSGA